MIEPATYVGICDRIVVGYGICGRGAIGIQTRDTPLAISKVHDCIGLFLDGDEAYRHVFNK